MLRKGAAVAYTKAKQRKKEENERLRGEREIRSSLFILDLKDGRLQDSGKQKEGKTFHKLHVLGMNNDLWGRICGLGSEAWKGMNESWASGGPDTPQRNWNNVPDLLRAMPVKVSAKVGKISN